MRISSMRGWVVRLLFVYLSAIILVLGIDSMHLRPDENLVYDFTRNDLAYLVTYLAEQDSHPLLWFSSFWFWRQLVGESEFAGRLLAVFTSLLTLALVYQIGRRWFGGARFGLFAVGLLGVNSYFFIYSLEIRPYAFILLLVTTSMWWFQRWLRQAQWRAAVFYAITLGLMLYVHYFLFVVMMVQGIYFLFQRPTRRLWQQAGGVVLVALLIWLPWLPFAINQVLHVRQAEVAGGNERGLLGAGSTTMPTSVEAVMRLVNLAFNGQVALYAVILLIGVVYLWRQSNYRLALVWALGVPAISLLVNVVVAVFLPRYVVYLVIGLALALGAGLAKLPKRVRWPVFGLVILLSLLSQRTQLPADRIPYRDLFQQVSLTARPDDVILFDSGGLNDGFVRAQVRRYLDPGLWQRRVNNVDDALEHRRLWYVTNGEWFDDGTRERFARIEQTHPLQQVIGRCDRSWCYLLQLMEGAPNDEPVKFGDAPCRSGGADVSLDIS